MHNRRLLLGLGIGALLLTLTWELAGGGSRTAAQSSFSAQVAALSEPAGYFDTDNLISNERSYLDVVPDLKKRGVKGGAYVGVGPDQNFSYIAAVRPEVVFIVDVRRDNLLLHLLFKALFAASRTRVEYLALLTGRPPPAKARPVATTSARPTSRTSPPPVTPSRRTRASPVTAGPARPEPRVHEPSTKPRSPTAPQTAPALRVNAGD